MKHITSLLVAGALASIVFTVGCATNPQTEQLLVTTAALAGTDALLQSQSDPAQKATTAAEVKVGATFVADLAGGTNQLTYAEVQPLLAAAGQTNSSVQLFAPIVLDVLQAYAQNGTSTNSVVLNATTAQLLTWTSTGALQAVQSAGF